MVYILIKDTRYINTNVNNKKKYMEDKTMNRIRGNAKRGRKIACSDGGFKEVIYTIIGPYIEALYTFLCILIEFFATVIFAAMAPGVFLSTKLLVWKSKGRKTFNYGILFLFAVNAIEIAYNQIYENVYHISQKHLLNKLPDIMRNTKLGTVFWNKAYTFFYGGLEVNKDYNMLQPFCNKIISHYTILRFSPSAEISAKICSIGTQMLAVVIISLWLGLIVFDLIVYASTINSTVMLIGVILTVVSIICEFTKEPNEWELAMQQVEQEEKREKFKYIVLVQTAMFFDDLLIRSTFAALYCIPFINILVFMLFNYSESNKYGRSTLLSALCAPAKYSVMTFGSKMAKNALSYKVHSLVDNMAIMGTRMINSYLYTLG
jgi:hypothetical protein